MNGIGKIVTVPPSAVTAASADFEMPWALTLIFVVSSP